MVIKVAEGIEINIDDEKMYSWKVSSNKTQITMKNGLGVDHYEYDNKEKKFQYKNPAGMSKEKEIEMLSGHLYNHLCKYSPLKEWLKSINLDGETYTKEIEYALKEWFKETDSK